MLSDYSILHKKMVLDVSLPARLLCSPLRAAPRAGSGAHLAAQETASGAAAGGSGAVLPLRALCVSGPGHRGQERARRAEERGG